MRADGRERLRSGHRPVVHPDSSRQSNNGKQIVTPGTTTGSAYLEYNSGYELKNPDWDFQ
ncbi:hypothetical protein PT2222_280102 [Paraburkholderia tropica]